ncbi:MAG: ABC transporter substrate-binding protein [Myxococcales bacterium]|nr:ABC transporter substrate-binding protein [Myxococcales bacterium]
MKAALLFALLGAARPWEAAPSVPPQWVGPARPAAGAKIERVVSLAPSVTETLFALGRGDRVVGVSRFDDRPAEVATLPKVGGFTDPNVEAIVALRPDLVLAAANASNRPGLERLSALGIPVYAVPGNSLADVFVATRAVAERMGAEAEAERVLAALSARLEAATARRRGAVKVLVVFGHDPLVAAGPGSLADTVLGILGARNAAGGVDKPYPQLGPEALVMAQPDVIIDATGEHGVAQSAPWRGLDGIPAVKQGRIHALPLATLLRPSPRLMEGVEALDALLWPPAPLAPAPAAPAP